MANGLWCRGPKICPPPPGRRCPYTRFLQEHPLYKAEGENIRPLALFARHCLKDVLYQVFRRQKFADRFRAYRAFLLFQLTVNV